MLLIYLLKMIACSAAFYGLYMLLFQNEKMLVFKRIYLLAALLLSFTIPLITFTVYTSDGGEGYNTSVRSVAEESTGWEDYTAGILAIIAISGAALLLVRFIKNLWSIWAKARNGSRQLIVDGATIILLQEPTVPHSFLHMIFLNGEEYRSHGIQEEVLKHELAHIQQRHSWDILFVELLQICCWFNPIIYLYKRSIKINHELLADAAVVKELGNMRGYQQILLQRAGALPSLALASSFHFFITKKRIIMLQKKANPVLSRVKAALCLPILALSIFAFSERVYAQKNPPKIVEVTVQNVTKTAPARKGIESTAVHYSKDRKTKSARINYSDGRVIEEDISTQEKAVAFENKYGVELPPPPPAAPRTKMAVPPPPAPEPAVNKMKEPAAPPPPPPAKKATNKGNATSLASPVIIEDEQLSQSKPPVLVKARPLEIKEVTIVEISSTKQKPARQVAANTKKVKSSGKPIAIQEVTIQKISESSSSN